MLSLQFLSGGTGITPMLQLVRHITRDPKDNTEMRLIFANQSESDILLRNELEEVAKEHPNQFKVWYTVDKASECEQKLHTQMFLELTLGFNFSLEVQRGLCFC